MIKYIPIIRVNPSGRGGVIYTLSKVLMRYSNQKDIVPLCESFEYKDLNAFLDKFPKLPEFFVDCPHYLAEDKSLKMRLEEKTTIVDLAKRVDRNVMGRLVPVISQENFKNFPNSGFEEEALSNAIQLRQMGYKKLAYRIFIGTEKLTDLGKVDNFVKVLRDGDSLLLDNISFEDSIECFLQNIRILLNRLEKENKAINVYVLNLFPIQGFHNPMATSHNYGPLIVKVMGLQGFGDMMIELRFSPVGRRSSGARTTGYIKIYDYQMHDLLEIRYNRQVQTPLEAVKGNDKAKSIMNDHYPRCGFCKGFLNDPTVDQKDYRNGHYLSSIINDVLPALVKFNDPHDIDMEGVEKISNIINGKQLSGC